MASVAMAAVPAGARPGLASLAALVGNRMVNSRTAMQLRFAIAMLHEIIISQAGKRAEVVVVDHAGAFQHDL